MKLRYKIDSNKLTIIRSDEWLKTDGRFIIDANQLVYEITETDEWRKEHDLPKRITLKGKWFIDKDHNLGFAIRKTQTQAGGEKLVLKTELIEAKSNSLIFSLGSEGKSGTYNIRLLQLKGKWQADKYNRLQFLIQRAKHQSDILTFQGIWDVKRNTLVYTYKKTTLKTKQRRTHALCFKGYWQISERNRLTYMLDIKNNSYFEFRTYLETPSILAKRGEIKYRAGIGIKGKPLFKTQIISLYGVWKLSRKAGLSLVLDYADGSIKTINFDAFVNVKEKDKVTLSLKSRKGKDLGISVTFTKSFLKGQASWFLRAIKEEKQPHLEWGVTIPW